MSTSEKALLRAVSEDRALGSAILFNHRHTFPTPAFHIEIMDLWRCEAELVLIEAFRDAAKSTLSEEFLTMEGAYGNFFYCLLIGETYAKACQRLESIAYEALTNVKLHRLFGRKILARKSIENKVFFSSGSMIEAIGWEQEIRGFKYRDRRPDRAYGDDVENLERVRETAAVDATMKKIWRELVPAMDGANRKIRFTQTPLAVDCMVTRARADPAFFCRSFPIANGDLDDPATVSAWPERFPMEWIRAERDRYERSGALRDFMQERMLTVDTSAAKPFDKAMIAYADLAPAAWLPRYGIFDPSRTVNVKTSDQTGKVVVSRLGSKILVHESSGHYWKPDEIRTAVFDTWEKHHCAEIGIEKNSLDEFLLQPIRHEMMKRGVAVPIRALQAPQDRDKVQFIMGLQPFFKAGDVVLIGGEVAHPQLVAQILNFPGGKLDIFNALAYSLKMFAGQPVYEDFGESNVAAAHEPARGETVYTSWNCTASETVCVVVLRHGRHLSVARDFAVTGAILDAVRGIAAELRANFPKSILEAWAPAELHDQSERLPLVAAMRKERLIAYRAEHLAVARGSLADKMRTTIRDRRCLTVDRRAPLTLNALAAGYKYPMGAGGKQKAEPEPGISRLVAEALETFVAMLERGVMEDDKAGAHMALNAQGVAYRTALPRPRARG